MTPGPKEDTREGYPKMAVGSLFSGIGGLELGLEMTGRFQTVWQVEQNEYCRKVLARHWPDATRFEDVRNVGKENLAPVDVICGGFPCQDISYAGKRAGIREGTRSGLWFEFARIVREMEPRYVIVENVAALLTCGLGDILGTLADFGYNAEWHCISAAAVGAPHLRNRIFIVAHASGNGRGSGRPRRLARDGQNGQGQPPQALADSNGRRCEQRDPRQRIVPIAHPSSSDVAYADSERRCSGDAEREDATDAWESSRRLQLGPWHTEPNVGRVASRVPHRVDRLRALGNAVVPQCAKLVGEWLLEIDRELREAA
jgi:DNA (cytosine-5)-methyltransferase 1